MDEVVIQHNKAIAAAERSKPKKRARKRPSNGGYKEPDVLRVGDYVFPRFDLRPGREGQDPESSMLGNRRGKARSKSIRGREGLRMLAQSAEIAEKRRLGNREHHSGAPKKASVRQQAEEARRRAPKSALDGLVVAPGELRSASSHPEAGLTAAQRFALRNAWKKIAATKQEQLLKLRREEEAAARGAVVNTGGALAGPTAQDGAGMGTDGETGEGGEAADTGDDGNAVSRLFADLAAGGAASTQGVSFDLVVSAVRRRRMLKSALGLGQGGEKSPRGNTSALRASKDAGDAVHGGTQQVAGGERDTAIDLSKFEIKSGLKQVVLQARSRYEEARELRQEEQEAIRRRKRRARRRQLRVDRRKGTLVERKNQDAIGGGAVAGPSFGSADSGEDSDSTAGSLISLGDPVQKARRDATTRALVSGSSATSTQGRGLSGAANVGVAALIGHSPSKRRGSVDDSRSRGRSLAGRSAGSVGNASASGSRRGSMRSVGSRSQLNSGQSQRRGSAVSRRRHSVASAADAEALAAMSAGNGNSKQGEGEVRIGFNDEDDEEARRLVKAGLASPYAGLAGMHVSGGKRSLLGGGGEVMVRGGAAVALLHAIPAKKAAGLAAKHLYLPSRARYRRGSMGSVTSKASKGSKSSKGSKGSKESGVRQVLAKPPSLKPEGGVSTGGRGALGLPLLEGVGQDEPTEHELVAATARTPRQR